MFDASAAHRVRPAPKAASAVATLRVDERDHDARGVLLPRSEIHLVVRFGPAAERGLDAHAMGGRDIVHRKVLRRGQRVVTARLRLGTTEAVLGVSASALAGRAVPIGELWSDVATARLFDRLAHARDTIGAAAILESAIAERVAHAENPVDCTALVLAAATRLESANVGAVAADLGVSERHLRRLFRETVGVGPKTFAKLTRFRRAVQAAREERLPRWAMIAAAAGYYDQAHLIAEFRAIAGVTPQALLGELRGAPSLLDLGA